MIVFKGVDLVIVCEYLVVYFFGDFLVDNGNFIVVFLVQFVYVEVNFNGVLWVFYVVDCMCDGMFFVDFFCKFFCFVLCFDF